MPHAKSSSARFPCELANEARENRRSECSSDTKSGRWTAISSVTSVSSDAPSRSDFNSDRYGSETSDFERRSAQMYEELYAQHAYQPTLICGRACRSNIA